MNVALNNAQNPLKHYEASNEKVQIEFVAYGPGLHMVRSDTSAVRERLSAFAQDNPKVVFSGCGNTMANQSKQENKPISLVAEARVVPTGIGRIVELQEQGWTYVRP
jgi:intracellular sulfur oxidation DsrE/DsrF family protein